jgi:hypothetical protein
MRTMGKDLKDFNFVDDVKEHGAWWRGTPNSAQTLQLLREAALRIGRTPDSAVSSAKRKSWPSSLSIAVDKEPNIFAVNRLG